MFKSGFSSQSGGRVPGCFAGFCDGIVLPFEPRDEPEEPFRDDEDESMSSLEESLLRLELLEEAKCRFDRGEKGDIRYCQPILTSSRLSL